MARVYTNENVALAVVRHLRALGNDVLTSAEAGNANRRVADPDVLQFANEQGRVLVTNNRRDFLRLHRQDAPHAGLVLYTVDSEFEALAERIDTALRATAPIGRTLIRVTKSGFTVTT